MQLLESPYQPEPPIKRFKGAAVQDVISGLNAKTSAGCELITELLTIGIKYLT
jgi:hypothetical protein